MYSNIQTAQLQQGYIHIGKNKVYFKKYGRGQRLLIALHGFAHDHKMFNILEQGLQLHFTVYALDLPYHGRTKWEKGQYGKKDINTVVEYILRQEGKQQCAVLGFSYGARIWMASLPYLRDKVAQMYLLAPDGLRTHWLGLAERTPGLFISLFQQLSNKQGRLTGWADRLRKLHLINRFAHRFVHHHLSTLKYRKRLFQTWRSMRHFRVKKRKVKEIIKEENIGLTVIVGKRDSIISLAAVKRMVRGLPQAQLFLLNKSHFLIDGSIAKLIK